MNEKYLFLNSYTEYLAQQGNDIQDIGLWNGKMGIAIYLLHFSRLVHSEKYENEAIKLIDAVYEKLSFETPFFFESGLLGIGCGFEYIIQNGFAEADRDEVLLEIDLMVRNLIDSRAVGDLSLKRGACGVGYYLFCRLTNRNIENESMVVLKLKEYLIYYIDWLEDLLQETTNNDDYNDLYSLLSLLHELNVFNHKVEKLLDICLKKMIQIHSPINDNYYLLGIDSLKILKPWIQH